MGIFSALHHSSANRPYQNLVDQVYELLCFHSRCIDRKQLDSVEITHQAVIVTNWGFDEIEAERKQQHALATLLNCGLIVDDHGFVKDNALMCCIQGIVSVPLAENGGVDAVSQKIIHYLASCTQTGDVLPVSPQTVLLHGRL